MMILTIRTDRPIAELGLYMDSRKLDYISWQADRQLSTTISSKIEKILNKSSKSLQDIDGLVVFKGPGSFTGLRIGFSVANALAWALEIPVISAGGNDWIDQGTEKLANGSNDKIALPAYGAPPKTTKPGK